MFRLGKTTALILAFGLLGLVGLGKSLEGSVTAGCPGGGGNPPGTPYLEAVLDETTQSLQITGHGSPMAVYAFRMYYSIGPNNWQHLGPISGFFDINGDMSLSIPLGVFQSSISVDAVMDLSVWDNTGPTSQFLTSMPWGMIMRRVETDKLRVPLGQSTWQQWQQPLPGTTSPTFTMSVGTLAAPAAVPSAPRETLVFAAGPVLLLHALYATGIEGMLPVN